MYIDINLLPQGFRPRKRLIKFDYRFLLAAVIISGAIGLGGYYFHIQRSLDDVADQIKYVKAQRQKVKSIVDLSNEIEVIKKKVENYVNIIKELTADSDLRFSMIDHINFVLPENLWLISITESKPSGKVVFDIEGMSYSKDDITKLLAGLEKFEKFNKVSLESITPAPLEDRDAYRFIVNVELKISNPTEEETATPGSRRRPRR